MKARILLTAASIVFAAAGIAMAADEPQVLRQQAMKQVGGATGASVKMLKGEVDYDPAAALAALTTISQSAEMFSTYFPDGSQSGFETEAAPAIWANMDDFHAQIAKFKAAADAGIAAQPADLDAFKAVFGPIGQSCGTCHETYRIKKS